MNKKCYLEIIQNWNRDSFHSSLIKVKDYYYMFNCSDGIQRDLFHIPGNQIKHVFLSSDKYETVYSYLALLYIQDKKSRVKGDFNILMKDKLFLWGPPKTREYFNSELFPQRILSKINEFNTSTQTFISEDIRFHKKDTFIDENIKIIPISNEVNNIASINYLVEIFDIEKDKSLFKTVLYLYFPSNLHAEKLFLSKGFKNLVSKYANIDLIIHIFDDKDIINKPFYIDFLLKFRNSKNIFDCPHFNPYQSKTLSKSLIKLFLNKTNKNLFTLGNYREEDFKPRIILSENLDPQLRSLNISYSQAKYTENLYPQEKENSLKIESFNYNKKKINEFEVILEKMFFPVEEKTISKTKNFHNQPEITFLGTSSARPTPFRNVSSILFNFANKGGLLLDCGEGTFNQIYEHFGPDITDKILLDLKVIFISHQHGDHFLGILKLIAEIIKIRGKLIKININDTKVWIIAPDIILRWIHKIFHNNIEFKQIFELICCEQINPNMKKVYNSMNFSEVKFKKINEIDEQINQFLKYVHSENNVVSKFYDFIEENLGINFYSIEVFHCDESYGCFFEDKEHQSWKISFSGDCRPCFNFINYSNYSTLTIHESTFEDKDSNQAKLSNHSCISEAIKVSRLNNSWRTILTHFSGKNSLSFEYSPEYEEKKILFAHDYLSFKLSDLEDAYKHTKTYSILVERLLKSNPNFL